MKVYLSGGMKSGWQDKIPEIENVKFFDPRKDSPQFGSAIEFVKADIDGVKESDLIFCYIEENNPSGIGAAWECAIAYENNIPIITVWEKSYIDPFFSCCSLYLYSDFDKGLDKLLKFVEKEV